MTEIGTMENYSDVSSSVEVGTFGEVMTLWANQEVHGNFTTWPSTTYSDAYYNDTLENNTTDLYGFNGSIVNTDNSTIDVLRGYPYPSLYSWPHIILSSIIVTIIMLVIVLGNTLVIVAVAVDRNLKGLQNWFITSLAVSDLFVGLFIMPLSLANELMGYWIFGNILCELWLAIDVLLCTASILNLCLISLDRYWSVTRAVSYVKTRTRKRAIIMITIVWLISMITCFPPLAGWKRPQPRKFGYPLCVLSEEPGYVVYSTVGSFYIPLIVMVLVYFKIYLAARSRARRNLKKPPPKHVPENGKSTSTSTTTSFTHQTKVCGEVNRLSPTREYSSEEEPSASASGQQSSHSGSRGSQAQDSVVADPGKDAQHVYPGMMKLSVANHNAHFPYSDEKRKLLSGEETCETDSACDTLSSKVKGGNERGRHIHFSEDTDSHSDFVNSQSHVLPDKKYCKEVGSGEENMRPLLQESDSQKESDRNSNSLFNEGSKVTFSDTKTSDSQMGDSTSDECVKLRPMHLKLTPEHEPNGKNETNQKQCLKAPSGQQHVHLSPTQHIRQFSNNLSRKHAKAKEAAKSRPVKEDPERFKRKVARAKERRATIVLGIIMATFIGCWLPFFSIYLITSLAGLQVPPMVFAVFFWLGYVNSALNPIIYTIFNRDFSHAFHRIIFGRKNTF